jgi:hypothetical protein
VISRYFRETGKDNTEVMEERDTFSAGADQ